jgi:hypothetical protein
MLFRKLPYGYLVVRDVNNTLWKVAFESTILSLPHLSSDALVSADPDLDGCPPICHGGADDAEMLLAHGHPGIEQVLAVEVQRRADELGDSDAGRGVSMSYMEQEQRDMLTPGCCR